MLATALQQLVRRCNCLTPRRGSVAPRGAPRTSTSSGSLSVAPERQGARLGGGTQRVSGM